MKTTKQLSSRRHFLKSGALLGLSALHYKALAGTSPNDRISVGFIGVGGMGTNRLKDFLQQEDVRAAAVCDLDEDHLNAALDESEKRQGQRPQAFHDFRDLLDRQDIDAVMIATPDHWHALPAITACEAGKDVFVEKPLSYSIGEGRKIVEAARANNRITQMGIHIHNETPNYRRAVELVQSGNLGKITRVHCWKTSTEKPLAHASDTQAPRQLDYEFWLGPAPKRPYNPNRSHFNYRYFWDYSGGHFIDFWCHITDVAYWALDLQGPLSVSATGGKFFLQDDGETPDTLDVLYQYPDQLIMAWSVHPQCIPVPGLSGSIGCVFQGTKATLVVNYNKNEVFVDGKPAPDFPRPEKSIPDSPGHIREFLDCIKTRQQATCNVEYGHRLTKGGLLGNIAYRTGEQVHWDDEHEKIIGSPEANKLVTRHYRRPWKLA